jgi:hypothetical protein
MLRAAATAFTLLPGIASAAQTIEVLSTAGCGCCISWTRHMEENGFETEIRNLPMADLMQVKTEGHVPARDVQRLLAERPDAIGLTVPDMPYGSPGMGEPGPDADPYDVLLVKRDGTTEVFASYR